jgi:hypothetical protein
MAAAASSVNTFDCSVCLEAIPSREGKWTRCIHNFHHACIDQWLKFKNTCPNCNFKSPLSERPTNLHPSTLVGRVTVQPSAASRTISEIALSILDIRMLLTHTDLEPSP